MDAVVGKNDKGVIVSMVECAAEKLLMAKSPRGKNARLSQSLLYNSSNLFERQVRPITTDNTSESADHKSIARKLHTSVYFARPYFFWEKGLFENANKLVRYFVPKGIDFYLLSGDYALNIQSLINRRPSKLLNFFSPKQFFFLYLHNGGVL